MVKVFIVEDSPVNREFLKFILESDPGIEVIGTARDGKEALEVLERVKPDIITMDINMPRMNGFETTQKIMATKPVPIVIVTGSWDPEEVSISYQAIEAGALACIARPRGIGHPKFEAAAQELVTTIKIMSEVKVVRRWHKTPISAKAPILNKAPALLSADIRIIAIGASSGGPVILKQILSQLPKHVNVPVMIVQHISKGFLPGFIDWLSKNVELPVHIASSGETVLPGNVYFAPDDFQMGINKNNQIVLSENHAINGLCPSVSYLFRTIAEVYGRKTAGILLTGMGRDGAEELKLMCDEGAVTIAQDKESSAVWGMPGEAVKLNAAKYILNPDEIAAYLKKITAV